MKKQRRVSLMLSMLLMGGVSLFAQEANKLGEVTVTSATLTEQALEDVPTTMQVIGAQEIQEMGALSVPEVLTKIQGLEQTNQKGAFNIRGMGFGYSVILINGRKPARLESNHDGLGFILSTINTADIERIEVIRGQAGAIYGANALAGVVNIITKKASEPSAAVRITGGNYESSVNGQINFGQVGKWDAILNAGVIKNRGVREDSVTTSDAWSESDSGSTTTLNFDAGYKFDDTHELRYTLGYIDQDRKSYSSTNVNTGGSVSKRSNINNALQYNLTTDEHFANVTAYTTRSWQTGTTKSYSFTDIGLDAKDSWTFNDNNLITFGIEYLHSTFNHPAAIGEDTIERESLFLQDEISLFNDALYVVPSVRYDHDSAFGGEVIPRLGITWHAMEGQRLKFNIGKAYIAPNLVQLYGEEERGTTFALGNSDLKPETSVGWEIRYEGDYENIRTSIGYFEADIEDKISSSPEFDLPEYSKPVTNNINIDGTVENKGVEASASVDLLDSFTLTGNYTWLDNKNQEGQRIGYYAEQTFGLDLQYTNHDWDFSTNLWGKYNLDYTNTTGAKKGDKNTYGDNIVYDYGVVNFSMNKRFSDKYSANFAVYNLWTTSRNSANDSSVSPLEWRVSLEARF